MPASTAANSGSSSTARNAAAVSSKSWYSSMSRLMNVTGVLEAAVRSSGRRASTTRCNDPSKSHGLSCDTTAETFTDT